MAFYSGFPFTNFRGVNLRNTAAIRLEGDGGFVGTFAIRSSQDASRQYFFPDKSGTFPISGTFSVNLPAVSANNIYNTNVTVSGVRTEDAMVATMQNMTATGMSERGYVFIGATTPANGGVNMTFVNATDTATVYKDIIVAYTTVR